MVGIVCGGRPRFGLSTSGGRDGLARGVSALSQVSASAQDDIDGVDKLSVLRTKTF